MPLISKFRKIAISGLLFLGLLGCSNGDEGGDVIQPGKTIANFIESNPDYSSLNAALILTNLKTTFAGDVEYTLFAANNAAFNTFLSENGFANLNAVPVEILTQELLNHVLPGKVLAANLFTGYVETAATLSPGAHNLSMYINVGDEVIINGLAEVNTTDLAVDNGVIHTVNSVISLPDITTFVMADPELEIFAAALTREEDFSFVSLLHNRETPAPFTVFAPNNEAFIDLLVELDAASMDEISANELLALLGYHLIAGKNIRSADFIHGLVITTIETGMLTINTTGGISLLDENGRISNVIATNVQATNGVVHLINRVLLPEMD